MPAITKRAICGACLRPGRTCFCPLVAAVACPIELLILQHPLEVANAKGSARLLHLSLPGSKLVPGECFDPAALRELLQADGKTPILLYPETPDARALGLPSPPALDPALLAAPPRLRLVVLDGTWRKSRKMLYQNPALQQLPRLALRQMPPSSYRIRKAHAPDQLSTLEAACYALMQIDGDPQRYQPILDGFDGFVTRALETRLGPG